MLTVPPQLTQMKTEFERARRWRRIRREPLEFGAIRWEALDRFLSLGFPTTREEAWRFTDIGPIAEKIFSLPFPSASDAKHVGPSLLHRRDDFAAELVFVNGYYLPEASTFNVLPSGARVESLFETLDSRPADVLLHLARVAVFERRPFVALNTGLFTDGACILIPANTAVEKPIHVRFISTGEADTRPAMSNPRALVVLDDSSQATIIESYEGPKGVQYFTNAVSEIVLGDNATLDHYRLQCESAEAYHTSATYVVAASGATCSAHSISLGGSLVRNDVVAVLGGESVKCTLDGLYIANRERLVDNHTTIEHVMPRCRSHEVYYGILADRAKSIFDGKFIVGADAHKSDAKQTSRTLLLSEAARANSTWHYQSLAKGVNCSQRVVDRQIDEDAAFYIRSRGLGDAEARRQAILTFVRNILKALPFQPLAHGVQTLLDEQLEDLLGSIT